MAVILSEINKSTAFITLNRPEKGNALTHEMILQLISLFDELNKSEIVRFIVLCGEGKNFCSGADLNWMIQSVQLSEKENLQEARELASLFRKISESDKITISKVHGSVIGGGVGLVAATDLVVAATNTLFSFSEVRLGLIPATIAPFILNRISEQAAKRFMLTGEKINSELAQSIGLVDYLDENADTKLKQVLGDLMVGAPGAQRSIKSLLAKLRYIKSPSETDLYTSELIAKVRSSEEGQQGINAFFEKVKPKWKPE